MKISKIEFENFRSFGEKRIVSLKNDINIILGENNVGKSNILNALIELKNAIKDIGSYKLHHNDWHNGYSNEKVKLAITFELELEEINTMFDILSDGSEIKKKHKSKTVNLKRDLGNKAELVMIQKEPKRAPNISLHIANLFIDSSGLAYTSLKSMEEAAHKPIKWKEILNVYVEALPGKSIWDVIKKNYKDKKNLEISFSGNIFQLICNMYSQKIKIFSDIRQKPVGENRGLYESFTGEHIDDVLLNLKNGNRNERKKYELIKKEFNTLFPNLELEAIRDRNEKNPGINIIKKDTDYEVPLQLMGTGIIEIITILTNIVEAENQIFGLEEPELHLHPHAQKLLLSFMSKHGQTNQIILLTHSPYFIDIDHIDNIILVKEIKGETTIRQIPKDQFDEDDLSRLSKILDVNTREIFFSKKVLLVEGETEIGALPIFANKMDKNFDKNSISIVWVGGKDSFRTILKLLRAFEIPYSAMCDRDSIMEISTNIDIGGKKIPVSSIFAQLYNIGLLKKGEIEKLRNIKSAYVKKNNRRFYKTNLFETLKKMALKNKFFTLTSDFEGVLEENGYSGLFEKAKGNFGRSKPRIGKYVAEEIVKQNKPIPKDFSTVIKKI